MERDAGGRVWYVDPLDGTTNFAHGFPLFSVSLGLCVDGARCWASSRRRRWAGRSPGTVTGGGSSWNGKPIAPSRVDRLGGALLVTGFPYARNPVQTNLPEWSGVHGGGAGDAAPGLGGARSVLRRVRLARRLLGARAAPVGSRRRRGDRRRARAAAGLGLDGSDFDGVTGRILASNGLLHEQMMRDPPGRGAPRVTALAMSAPRRPSPPPSSPAAPRTRLGGAAEVQALLSSTASASSTASSRSCAPRFARRADRRQRPGAVGGARRRRSIARSAPPSRRRARSPASTPRSPRLPRTPASSASRPTCRSSRPRCSSCLRDHAPGADAVVPRVAGRAEPLLARYARASRPSSTPRSPPAARRAWSICSRASCARPGSTSRRCAPLDPDAALVHERQHARGSRGGSRGKGAVTGDAPRLAAALAARARGGGRRRRRPVLLGDDLRQRRPPLPGVRALRAEPARGVRARPARRRVLPPAVDERVVAARRASATARAGPSRRSPLALHCGVGRAARVARCARSAARARRRGSRPGCSSWRRRTSRPRPGSPRAPTCSRRRWCSRRSWRSCAARRSFRPRSPRPLISRRSRRSCSRRSHTSSSARAPSRAPRARRFAAGCRTSRSPRPSSSCASRVLDGWGGSGDARASLARQARAARERPRPRRRGRGRLARGARLGRSASRRSRWSRSRGRARARARAAPLAFAALALVAACCGPAGSSGARYFYLPAVGLAWAAAEALAARPFAARATLCTALLALGAVQASARREDVVEYEARLAAARRAVADGCAPRRPRLPRRRRHQGPRPGRQGGPRARAPSRTSSSCSATSPPRSSRCPPRSRERAVFLLASPPLPPSGAYRFGAARVVGPRPPRRRPDARRGRRALPRHPLHPPAPDARGARRRPRRHRRDQARRGLA